MVSQPPISNASSLSISAFTPVLTPTLVAQTFNVQLYGAFGNGTNDDTAAIQSAIQAAAGQGGIVLFPPGTYKISAPLVLNAPDILLQGSGIGTTTIQPSAGFSGIAAISIVASGCGVTNMDILFTSTTYSSNPAANGIEIGGAQSVYLMALLILYANGWGVESAGTATQANSNVFVRDVRTSSCKQGFHFIGNTGSSFNGSSQLLNLRADTIQNGDAFLFEDVVGIMGTNLIGSCSAGSGNALHIKGAVSTIDLDNVNFGLASGGPSTGATALIETGTNGTPTQVTVESGIVQGGAIGFSITAGTFIDLIDLDILNNGTHGISVGGGDHVLVSRCQFNGNGVTAGASRYDVTVATTNRTDVNACLFSTATGSSTGQTNAAVNDSGGASVVQDCHFIGTTPISANKPKVIRNNPGYNPVGVLGPPSVPTTTTPLANPYGVDCTVHITGGTITAIAIGGTATGLTSGTFSVPATQTIAITYTGSPTWTWFGS